MRRIRSCTLLLLAFALTTASCVKSGTPSGHEIRGYKLDHFIVDDKGLVGDYVNFDIDSLVFHYETAVTPVNEVWSRINARIADTGWTEKGSDSSYRRYVRVTPMEGQRKYGSSEEVRVAIRKASSMIVVGYVQADSERAIEDTQEGEFAERVVWPLFDSLVAK
ncbi:MAG: hypothetical protein HZA46_01985 [Planctomycetales bacterium]|nr:hypothetical protein [Planctomycetales bacterium]